MGEDEAGTLARLRSHEAEIIAPAVARHRGRIVKRMGDGFLVEFGSVVAAVQCAVDWQRGIADDAPLRFRIGINLGDVIVEGDDIYGDGVNLAARLEPLAEPGGICVSEDAFRQLRGKLDLAWEDMGPQELKNIAVPVGAYRLGPPSAEVAAERPSAGRARTHGEKPTVAVLPFTNMSGDPEQEYFSDGITEDLITEISRFRELAVVSRSSSFVFKGKTASAAEVCAKLKAQYLVEGSIRKAGNRVRVAISTAYWPIVWPTPEWVTLGVHTGASRVVLPVRAPRAEDEELPDFPPPETGPSNSGTVLRDSTLRRTIERDLLTGDVIYRIYDDGGEFDGAALIHLEDIDLEAGFALLQQYHIGEASPLTASGEIVAHALLRRGVWAPELRGRIEIRATKDAFIVSANVTANDGLSEVFTREWHETIPRELV